MEATTAARQQSLSCLLADVKAADQDFEWYPTTARMVELVARQLDQNAESILDIGAGDGRVLSLLAERFKGRGRTPLLYAIEKSTVLIQAQPEDVLGSGVGPEAPSSAAPDSAQAEVLPAEGTAVS